MKVKKDAGSSDIGENSSSINGNKEIRKVEGMKKKSPYFSMLNLNLQNNSPSTTHSFPLDLGSGRLAV